MRLPLQMPARSPAHGDVLLRAFTFADVPMLRDLATDPYVPSTGTLPAHADEAEARQYIQRQHDRLTSGSGYSFCAALLATNEAVGQAGLWFRDPRRGCASAGYAIAPCHRGNGYAGQALTALTAFAWTLPDVSRVELFIEPWNLASRRAAANAGYRLQGPVSNPRRPGGPGVDMLLYSTSGGR